MNWAYKLFWSSVMVASISMMLTACGKKSNDAQPLSVQGNVTTDGQGINSVSTLNNSNANFSVSNIQRNSYGTLGGFGYANVNPPNLLLNNYSGFTFGSAAYQSFIINSPNYLNSANSATTNSPTFITFSVAMNGSNQTFTMYPRIGNAEQTQKSSGVYSVNSFTLDIDTSCDNNNCDTVYINILINRDKTAWKQVALMKNMINFRIESAFEKTTSNYLEISQSLNLFGYLFEIRAEK